MDAYGFAIEELSLSNEVGLGDCSASTVYRWARVINERLAWERAAWRVRPLPREHALVRVPAGDEKKKPRGD